jgi:AraC-like DNA-binding protein
MLLIEAFFRFGSIGLLCAIGLLILRDGRNNSALLFALPLIISVICLFLSTGSENLIVTGPLAVVLRLIDMMVFVFAWWFGLALFDDDFHLGIKEWSIAIFFACILAPMRLYHQGFDVPYKPEYDYIISVLTLLLLAHLAYKAILGRREDLIENRRRVRVLFAAAIIAISATSVVMEVVLESLGRNSQWSMFVTYVVTFFLSIWAILWLSRLHPEHMAFRSTVDTSNKMISDPLDAVLRDRLIKVMQQDRAYAEHGLSIGDLADKVELPAHQLRSLINRSMGYRNFSAFLNHYRLTEVKAALADKNKSRTPILSIALDAGFSSLAPFNRAFKTNFGLTPTEYRTQSTSESTD